MIKLNNIEKYEQNYDYKSFDEIFEEIKIIFDKIYKNLNRYTLSAFTDNKSEPQFIMIIDKFLETHNRN